MPSDDRYVDMLSVVTSFHVQNMSRDFFTRFLVLSFRGYRLRDASKLFECLSCVCVCVGVSFSSARGRFWSLALVIAVLPYRLLQELARSAYPPVM